MIDSCALCHHWLWQGFICSECENRISHRPLIVREMKELSVFSLLHYFEPMRNLIRNCKGDQRPRLLRFLGQILAEKFAIESLEPAQMVIPAPAKETHRIDHAFLLADGIARTLQASFESRLLKRVKTEVAQKQLTIHQRQTERLGLIDAQLPLLSQTGVLILVDDVVTTGATLREMARHLKHLGLTRFVGLTLASTPRYDSTPLLENKTSIC